jgi:hypothetical protein
MSQISRPFQIALVAIVALALVWLVFLRGHSSSSESSSSTASSSAQPATAAQPSAAGSASSGSSSAGSGGSKAGSTPYHGSAPGVAGLTRAITKARGAVAQSQREAKAHSGPAGAQGSSSSGAAHPSQAGSQSSPGGAGVAPSAKAAPSEASSAKINGAPVQEAAVQSQLKDGRTVIILFWSPRGADDRAVHLELQLLKVIDKKIGNKADKKLAVHYAHAAEVGQFGTITRSLQILQTPTLLVISPSGNTKTITGLTDAYAIQQAISEARHP